MSVEWITSSSSFLSYAESVVFHGILNETCVVSRGTVARVPNHGSAPSHTYWLVFCDTTMAHLDHPVYDVIQNDFPDVLIECRERIEKLQHKNERGISHLPIGSVFCIDRISQSFLFVPVRWLIETESPILASEALLVGVSAALYFVRAVRHQAQAPIRIPYEEQNILEIEPIDAMNAMSMAVRNLYQYGEDHHVQSTPNMLFCDPYKVKTSKKEDLER